MVWQPTGYSTNQESIGLTSMALIMAFKGCSIFLFGFSSNGGIKISFLRYKDLFLQAESPRKKITFLFRKHPTFQHLKITRFCEYVSLQANQFLMYTAS